MDMEFMEAYKVRGETLIVMRDDLRYKSPLPHHAKMEALDMLIRHKKSASYKLIGCFCTTHGIWQFGLPHLALKHNMDSIVVYPSMNIGKIPQGLRVNLNGYRLEQIKPNMVAINGAQAKRIVEDAGGYYVPFGVDEMVAVHHMSNRINIGNIGTLIVPCGSGVTLAAILMSIVKHQNNVEKIVAVSAGRPIKSIKKTILQYTGVPDYVEFIDTYKYDEIPDISCPWNAHPYYELKAYDWLYNNIKRLSGPIIFYNIGSA